MKGKLIRVHIYPVDGEWRYAILRKTSTEIVRRVYKPGPASRRRIDTWLAAKQEEPTP